MKSYEAFRAQRITANGSYLVGGNRIAAFLPSAGGTIAVTDADGTTLVAATTVTAGVYVELPIRFNTNMGGTVTLASDAAGTLLL